MNIRFWLMAFRPKTLTAAVVPILAATALVSNEGLSWSPIVVYLSMAAALCIQVATNLINDAIDCQKGADNADRLGPVRVSASGLLAPKTVMIVGFFFLILAMALGLPLVYIGGWPIFVIGIVSIVLAYLYTGGPAPLAYVGLGDLFVILFFGLVAVGGVYYLHTGTWTVSAFVLGLQVGLLATVLIAINNLRDVNQDIKANKKTLAVRFGVAFVRKEISALVLLTFCLQLFWFFRSGFFVGAMPFLVGPLGWSVVSGMRNMMPSSDCNQFLARSAALHAGFGGAISLALSLA